MTTFTRRLGVALLGLMLGLCVLFAVAAGPAAADPGGAPVITLQPVDTTGYVEGTVQFTAAASATAEPTVWWEYSTDNGATWFSGGQFSDTYTLGSLSMSEDGDLVRAGFSDPGGQTYTSAARLTVLPAQPAASLDTTDLTFGNTQTGRGALYPQTVTVTDSGTRPLGFGNAYDGSDSFYIESDSCSTHVLQPGASCSISVSFLPSHDGPISGALAIPDNANGAVSQQVVDLHGFGAEPATLGANTSVGGLVGDAFHYTAAVGGLPAPSLLVSAGALPPGLSLEDPNAIVGTPTHAGTYQATLEATNGVGSPAYETITFSISPNAHLTLSPASLIEGKSGRTAMTFTYTLARPAVVAGSFHFATKDGTATAGSDYVRTFGTATVAAGTQVGHIVVQIKGDRTPEPDEQFTLALSKASGIVLVTHSAVGTIVNDD